MGLFSYSDFECALLHLRGLKASATHKFRLKGPFPEKDYKDPTAASQAILDAFHVMAMMIARESQVNRRDAEILAHTRREREDLCARISHLFYLLAGLINLGYPLMGRLPKTDISWDSLFVSLYELREGRSAALRGIQIRTLQ